MNYIFTVKVGYSVEPVSYFKSGPSWEDDRAAFLKWVSKYAKEYEFLTGSLTQTLSIPDIPWVTRESYQDGSVRLTPTWFIFGVNEPPASPEVVITIMQCHF